MRVTRLTPLVPAPQDHAGETQDDVEHDVHREDAQGETSDVGRRRPTRPDEDHRRDDRAGPGEQRRAERHERDVDAPVCTGSSARPVSSSSATSSSSRPPAPCMAGSVMPQVVEDPPDRTPRTATMTKNATSDGLPSRADPFAVLDGRPVSARKTRHRARRVHDDEQGDEDSTKNLTCSTQPRSCAGPRVRPRRLRPRSAEHRGVGGVLAEPVVLAGAVVVAGAGDEQAQLGGQRPQVRALGGLVVAVVDLEAGQAGGGQLRDRRVATRRGRAGPQPGGPCTGTPPAPRTSRTACTGSGA